MTAKKKRQRSTPKNTPKESDLVAPLQNRIEELENQVMQQEHRWINIIHNFLKHRKKPFSDPKKWSAIRAIISKLFAPSTVVATSSTFVAVLTLMFLFRQTKVMENQTSEMQKQSKSFEEQLSLQNKEAQKRYRSELIKILYSYENNRGDTVATYTIRERQEALKSFLDLERKRLNIVSSKNCNNKIDLSDAQLEKINLTGIDISNCIFERTKFDFAIFCQNKINDTEFKRVSLKNADLHQIDFTRCKISNSNFSGTNFSKTNFIETQIDFINKSKVLFKNCTFIDSYLASNFSLEGSYYSFPVDTKKHIIFNSTKFISSNFVGMDYGSIDINNNYSIESKLRFDYCNSISILSSQILNSIVEFGNQDMYSIESTQFLKTYISKSVLCTLANVVNVDTSGCLWNDIDSIRVMDKSFDKVKYLAIKLKSSNKFLN